MRYFAPIFHVMLYDPPSPQDIERLKSELGLTGKEMAELFGVSSDRAFRRYTSTSPSDKNRRDLSAYMLFFAMARLELNADAIERILARMRRAGATIDLAAGPEPDGEQQP